MKKSKLFAITIIATLTIVGIVYAGVDAFRHPSDAVTPELREDEEFYYSIKDNGDVETIPKSDTITVPSGYAVVEDGHIIDFIFVD